MLGDTRPLEEWAARDDPPLSVYRAVQDWVGRLSDAPWQSPSVQIVELSNQPVDEVRRAVVPGSGGVSVYYRNTYGEDVVDLIGVASADTAP